ncbi:SCO family protein [Anaerolineales bacterium HSG25]|nr:SCO family protein [Anaerolineales bacterium HSG25]
MLKFMINRFSIEQIILFVSLFILLGTACQPFASAPDYKGAVMDPPLPIADFELLDTEQKPFQLSDMPDNIKLVFFGYTYCPDVCPLTLANVRQALDGLPERERVSTIFVTVDPERDSPDALARYLNAFDSSFIGLSDTAENTAPVLESFGAYAKKQPIEGSDNYLVDHTARLYLVTPKQEILLTYPFGFSSEDLRSDLEYLLAQ